MNQNDMVLEIPYGTRDFLPDESAAKRVIESRLMNIFSSWGYDEIVTPVIEYLDTLTMEGGETIEPHLFKFFDRNNRTIALRHEMTTPIARVVASRMREEPRPLRLSYVSDVCRYEEAQAGRQCEFYQAGVELMGSASPAADAEVIALAAECMRKSGLKNFQICLGEVEFVSGLMRQFHLGEETQEKIKGAMERRDLVTLKNIVDETSMPAASREVLANLPLLHGGEEIIKKAWDIAINEESRRALDNLSAIYRLLKSYGVADAVYFDLGVIRDFSYYTGMVFEAYTPGLGFPLAGGGRYDRLLSDFGAPCPATGFALGIERLMLALEREGQSKKHTKKDVFIAYADGKLETAIEAATKQRADGKAVELSPSPMTEAEAESDGRRAKYDELIYVK
ncbi:MAG: ATP phosphoribosyltransferase regulatory subunit [Selenomonadaceae bacterium]